MTALNTKFARIAAMLAVVMAAGVAELRAQIVTNGGFESGNFGWTYSPGNPSVGQGVCNPAGTFSAGDTPSATGATGATTGAYAHTGSWFMWMGAMGCTPSVSQTLATAAGDWYDLNFWVLANPNYGDNRPNFFQVWINDNVLFTHEFTNNTYQMQSLQFLGTGNDALTFYADNVNGSTNLDDVSVTTVTPEPMSMMLMATGLIGVAGAWRRRKPQA